MRGVEGGYASAGTCGWLDGSAQPPSTSSSPLKNFFFSFLYFLEAAGHLEENEFLFLPDQEIFEVKRKKKCQWRNDERGRLILSFLLLAGNISMTGFSVCQQRSLFIKVDGDWETGKRNICLRVKHAEEHGKFRGRYVETCAPFFFSCVYLTVHLCMTCWMAWPFFSSLTR